MNEDERIRELKRLPTNYYSYFAVSASSNPIQQFIDRYGFEPTKALVGKRVNLDIPDSIEVVGSATTGHIGLR